MDKIIDQLQYWCKQRDVELKTIEETSTLKAYHIPKKYKNKTQHLGQHVRKLAIESYAHSFDYSMKEGIIIIISENPITDELSASIIGEVKSRNYRLIESIDKSFEEKAKRQEKPEDRFLTRDEIKNMSKGKLAERKSFDEKIDAILEMDNLAGIATPNNIQPKQGIDVLRKVLKATGLGKILKDKGIRIHVAQPGSHAVTFLRGDVPVLKKDTVSIADSSTLSELISELESIARGEAPEAGRMESERAKKRESDASTIAKQYSVEPQPEVEI